MSFYVYFFVIDYGIVYILQMYILIQKLRAIFKYTRTHLHFSATHLLIALSDTSKNLLHIHTKVSKEKQEN